MASDAGKYYSDARQAQQERRRDSTRAAQDIGELPKVVDPVRRARCVASLREFCECYFPLTFALAWSRNHEVVLAKLENAIKYGDLFALAMPRGSGKTAIGRVASLWSLLGGWRRFVVYLAANASKAGESVEIVKTIVRGNPALFDDFGPELLGFWQLENEARRCKGQRYNGESTHIAWDADGLVFPTVGGSCDGAVIRAFGLDSGNIRGTQHMLSDGQTIIRPDFVIVDDPQTKESAGSPSQVQSRWEIVNADVLGMAGPGVRISGAVLCTVIEEGDLADRLLDRKQSPDWHGERMRLLDAMPTNLSLWDRYAEIKHECQRLDQATVPATEFYRENQAAMDDGAKPTWPERFDMGQASAIQYAMDLYYRDPYTFAAEYQNQPQVREGSDEKLPPADKLIERVNQVPRGTVPSESTHLTAFIDVQQDALFWAVCGFDQGFTGSVIDYGCYPEQSRRYFTLRDVTAGNRKLSDIHPGSSLEAQIYAGLAALCEELLGREWKREGGEADKIERCLVDSGWGRSTKTVKTFCKQSKFNAVLMPSHGRGIGATETPMNMYQQRTGEILGEAWRIAKKQGREVAYDTNYWKSFLFSRMTTGLGSSGAFTFCGKNVSEHRMLGDHLVAESRVKVSAKGRTIDEWKMRPEKPDNHWLDCLVGCHVAASMSGCSLKTAQQSDKSSKPSRRNRRNVSYL